MYRKKIFWMAFAVCGFSVAAIVHAQNDEEESRPRTLADRFEAFRNSFGNGRPLPMIGGRTVHSGDRVNRSSESDSSESTDRNSASRSRNTSSRSNDFRRPGLRFGRPGMVTRRRTSDDFREPPEATVESPGEPVEAPGEEPAEFTPETSSPFSRRTTDFRASTDDFDEPDSGSSRRRGGFKRLGTDRQPESVATTVKPDDAESKSSSEPAKAVEPDHEVFTPMAEEPAASVAETKAKKATPTEPIAESAAPVAETKPAEPARSIVAESTPSVTESAITEEELLSSDLLIATESPALSVRTAGPRKIVVGRESLFEVKIQNAAGTDADGVVVSVDLPDWAEVAGTEPTSGTAYPPQNGPEARPLEWHVGHLAGGNRETLRLKIVPRKSIPFELGVRWTFTPKGSQAKVEVQEPKLTMRIAGADEVRYGQTETYRLIVGNPGTGDAEDVVVNLLPNGPGNQAVASVKLGTIEAGEEIVREIAVTPREEGELRVRAQAIAAGGLKADVDQRVLIRRAALEIEALGPRVRYSGTEATFAIKLTNTGNYMAQNVMVSTRLPAGATYVRDSGAGSLNKATQELNWRVISLPAGAIKELKVVCLLSKPGVNHLNVVAKGSDDISEQAMASTRVDALADLRMSVVDPQGPVPTSEEATYQIRIVNRGNKAAEEIDLVVFFSAGMEPVVAEGATHRIAEGQVTFNRIATIAAGEERVLKVRAKAKQGGSHILRAELVCGELETKLAVEETTRFYDESSQASNDTGGLSRQADAAPLRRVP
ncbi:MAG: hypothetical protein MI757_08945, partial [Pirellulales bacterium]|nr:hypothetical protein [Pirellulales bacterium]